MKRKTITIIHVLFWIYIFLQTIIPPGEEYKNIITIPSLTFYMLSIVEFYFVYFVLSNILLKRKNISTVILIVFISIIILPLSRLVIFDLIMHIAGIESIPLWGNISGMLWNHYRISLLFTFYGILIRFAIEWYDSSKKRDELILQNKESELTLLRSQINPHFLFNTLNNIYSLVYTKSEEAPSALLKLSEIMRYMFNDANIEKVSLDKDIIYLRSYIELQQLRLSSKEFVKFNITGNIENQLIAPMLLITFVENAFKHSDKKIEGVGININLLIENDKLFFDVMNYCKGTNEDFISDSNGIGLNNVKRRLQLIYPDKHTLLLTTDDKKHIVKLIIDLK